MITFRLSSTALGSIPCTLRLYRQTILGLREKAMPARIIYGIAVHKFLDTMYKTGDPAKAVMAAKKAFALPKIDDGKSKHLSEETHMITVCFNLWTGFVQSDSAFEILQVDKMPLTEQTFSFLIYEDEYIRVLFEGTLDKLGKFVNGVFAIGDWKTTSTWDEKTYFMQYELSRQLRCYRLATILEARINPSSPLGIIGSSKCGVFIDGIFLKPERNEVTVKRSGVFVWGDDVMKPFEAMLMRYCRDLSMKVRDGVHLEPEGTLNGTCEGKWGKCPYWNLCKTPKDISKILQERDFDVVEWQPQNYNGLEDTI